MVEPGTGASQYPHQMGKERPGKRTVYVGLLRYQRPFDESRLHRGDCFPEKDYRFKIGTIGEKKPEDWIVVEGQHEPLIDRMSFDIVQNKLKSRQRPGQTNEISLFAGLIKCGECGKSLTIRYTNAKHPQQIYSCKTYNAFGKNHCTQHRIDYDTLYSHVLRKIRECARAALMDGEAVADRLTNTCEAEQREQREAMERSLTRDEERIEVLDKMVMRLYEDMIAGRISEQNFNTMLEKHRPSRRSLKQKCPRAGSGCPMKPSLPMTQNNGWKPFRNMPTSQSWTQPPLTA